MDTDGVPTHIWQLTITNDGTKSKINYTAINQ